MFLFKEEHVPMITTGFPRLKTQTRRLHTRRRAVPGSLHWAQRGMKADTRFARLHITKAWEERLHELSEADAHAEGYAGRDDYFYVFTRINKDKPFNYDTVIWCYECECIDGTPLGRAITARLYAKGVLQI